MTAAAASQPNMPFRKSLTSTQAAFLEKFVCISVVPFTLSDLWHREGLDVMSVDSEFEPSHVVVLHAGNLSANSACAEGVLTVLLKSMLWFP